MSCNHNCQQGRACDCYRINFDLLGQPVDEKSPLTLSDFLVAAFSVLCVIGFVSGIFSGVAT